MDMSKLPPQFGKVADYLAKLEAQLPPELRELATSTSEKELYRQVAMTAIEHLMAAYTLYAQARARCGVCEQDRDCGHCFAENEQMQGFVRSAVSLALLVKIATSPGSRAYAEAEREAEQASKEPTA